MNFDQPMPIDESDTTPSSTNSINNNTPPTQQNGPRFGAFPVAMTVDDDDGTAGHRRFVQCKRPRHFGDRSVGNSCMNDKNNAFPVKSTAEVQRETQGNGNDDDERPSCSVCRSNLGCLRTCVACQGPICHRCTHHVSFQDQNANSKSNIFCALRHWMPSDPPQKMTAHLIPSLESHAAVLDAEMQEIEVDFKQLAVLKQKYGASVFAEGDAALKSIWTERRNRINEIQSRVDSLRGSIREGKTLNEVLALENNSGNSSNGPSPIMDFTLPFPHRYPMLRIPSADPQLAHSSGLEEIHATSSILMPQTTAVFSMSGLPLSVVGKKGRKDADPFERPKKPARRGWR